MEVSPLARLSPELRNLLYSFVSAAQRDTSPHESSDFIVMDEPSGTDRERTCVWIDAVGKDTVAQIRSFSSIRKRRRSGYDSRIFHFVTSRDELFDETVDYFWKDRGMLMRVVTVWQGEAMICSRTHWMIDALEEKGVELVMIKWYATVDSVHVRYCGTPHYFITCYPKASAKPTSTALTTSSMSRVGGCHLRSKSAESLFVERAAEDAAGAVARAGLQNQESCDETRRRVSEA